MTAERTQLQYIQCNQCASHYSLWRVAAAASADSSTDRADTKDDPTR